MSDSNGVTVVKQTIGQSSPQFLPTTFYAPSLSYDYRQPNYGFWDKLRQGKAKGYNYSAAIVRPAAVILSTYTLGKSPPSITLQPNPDEDPDSERLRYTNERIARFINQNFPLILRALYDALTLGDSYIVVNPDGSLVSPSPDSVRLYLDEEDYRKIERLEIVSRSDKVTTRDVYTDSERIVITERVEGGRLIRRAKRYRNVIGRIPVIHFPYLPSNNEIYGHSAFEPVLGLLSAYNDLWEKLIKGVDLLSNPIPVFEGVSGIGDSYGLQRTLGENLAEDTYTDEYGITHKRAVLSFDRHSAIFTGAAGSFKFVHPEVGFTSDTLATLDAIKALFSEHLSIPRVMWGDKAELARSIAEAQQRVFERTIMAIRHWFKGRSRSRGGTVQDGLLGLVDIWLRYRRLIDRNMIVRPIEVTKWARISDMDEGAELQRIIYAHSKGLIGHATALELLGLVSNPEAEVEAAAELREGLSMADNKEPARFINALEREAVIDTEGGSDAKTEQTSASQDRADETS